MNINNSATDLTVSIAKGIIGIAPVYGPLVAEIVGNLIPNQRIDRLADFVRTLDAKLATLDKTTVEAKLKAPEFIDLLEDGFMAAARALSKERREQIAALFHNSFAKEDLAAAQAKKLLQILSELNDNEIILLQFYAKLASPDRDAYRDAHKDVIIGPRAYIRAPPEVLDQAALHDAMKAHLSRLELIQPHFSTPPGREPEFDNNTGMMKVSYWGITWLGRLLLRMIDLDDGMRKKERHD